MEFTKGGQEIKYKILRDQRNMYHLPLCEGIILSQVCFIVVICTHFWPQVFDMVLVPGNNSAILKYLPFVSCCCSFFPLTNDLLYLIAPTDGLMELSCMRYLLQVRFNFIITYSLHIGELSLYCKLKWVSIRHLLACLLVYSFIC